MVWTHAKGEWSTSRRYSYKHKGNLKEEQYIYVPAYIGTCLKSFSGWLRGVHFAFIQENNVFLGTPKDYPTLKVILSIFYWEGKTFWHILRVQETWNSIMQRYCQMGLSRFSDLPSPWEGGAVSQSGAFLVPSLCCNRRSKGAVPPCGKCGHCMSFTTKEKGFCKNLR